jgi:formate/nitrite transporter FocA (FNT family)
MIVACASRRITLGALIRAWPLVYVGNITGAVATAALMFLAKQHEFGGGAVGKTALAIASESRLADDPTAFSGDALQRAGLPCRVDVVRSEEHNG